MKYIKHILILLIGAFLMTSCESYLDEVPDNRTQINSKEKISELLVAAYPRQNFMAFTAPMTDNAGDKGNINDTQDTQLKAYSWEVQLGDQQDSPLGYWGSCYAAIAQANQALASIDELEGNIDEDLAPQKGEALLCRAYAHFMLVNLWAKHYDSSSAASDLGVPFVEEPEDVVIKRYTRSSVQEVYDKIERDITIALDLVDSDYIQSAYHFTPQAALAFATRFYLYKGDWDKVIEYSNQLLQGNPSANLKDWTYYTNNFQVNELAAIILTSKEKSNILVDLTTSDWSIQSHFTRFGLTQVLQDELIGSANPYGKQWSYGISQYSSDGLTRNVNKFEYIFEYSNLSAGIGFAKTSHVLFTYDEALLARSEAYAMKNQFDNAISDINAYLPKRTKSYNSSTDVLTATEFEDQYPDASDYKPFYDLTPSQASFVKGIAELRRREFYSEGVRWFDIKRFHIPVTHSFANQNDKVLESNDNRRLLQIPSTAISFGVEKNPR